MRALVRGTESEEPDFGINLFDTRELHPMKSFLARLKSCTF
jgi:hypothetical protein